MKNKVSFKKSIVAGISAAMVASIINVVLFFIFKSLGVFVDDIFIQPNQPLSPLPIIFSSVVPTLIASSIYFLLDKYTSNGYKIFGIISIVLLLLSFANPFFGIPKVTVPYALALNLMHVVVVFFLFYFINKARKNN